ncbi:MAG: osmosensitive channel signal transduction histidine kinase, partial [Chloroflexi bacterium]|nr:osmosensitive channel signal transduction histidine kinase [Chloroflexota bacterium]
CTGVAEACDVTMLGARFDRFLATVLVAGPLLAVPVRREGAVIGVLVLVRERGGRPFGKFDQQKAAVIAAQAAGTLHRVELYHELADKLRESTLVHRFATQAVAARTVKDIAWELLESIRSYTNLDRGSVCLADANGRPSVTPVVHFHARLPDRNDAPVAQIVHMNEPMHHGQLLIGTVDIYRGDGVPFGPSDERFVQALTNQAAVAIRNLRLLEESGKVSTYRELDRMKTDLLNAVSHDLRGPLTNIKGYANTLVESRDELSAEEQVEFLHTIEEEADRLRDLIEHLLDLSQIDAGVLRVDLQPVHVRVDPQSDSQF